MVSQYDAVTIILVSLLMPLWPYFATLFLTSPHLDFCDCGFPV